ncbi:MAG: chemotaxis response regulator protein-glutamate methylesterase [Candidatus Korobacteraceae bacterium]|jgi:two-component system chemotaxis response regulator CheB
MIKVLVVDDSALMRKLIPRILEKYDNIRVVGTAMDGEFALRKIADLRPDVVTLDLEMPRMDGMATLREIMKRHKLPVIIVSAHTTTGAMETFKALNFGAFDFVAKPCDALSEQIGDIAQELASKIRAAAESRRVEPAIALPMFRPVHKRKATPQPTERVVAIGLSTGGPNALQYILSQLPAEFPAAIVVVQHMAEGFTGLFAQRLDAESELEVKEAESGDLLLAGRVLICPGTRHMKVRRMPLGNVVVLTSQPPVNGVRPSVDVLFRSVAEEFGPSAVAALMTGMGEDGAVGLGEVKARGGFTIAQDEQTCAVYGMPRAAIERGNACKVLSLELIPAALQAEVENKDVDAAEASG